MGEIWSSQCAFNLSSWKSNLKKKIQAWTGFESTTLRYRCNALSLSYQATWIDGQLWVRYIPDDSERYEYEYMKIIYVKLRMKHGWNLILAVCFQLKQLKKQPEKKKFRLERDSNPWPCDTGAMFCPLSYQATWIDGQLWVRYIPDDSKRYEYKYIWKSYMWTADETWVKFWSSQCAFNLSSWKSNLKKNSGLNGIRHD